MKEKELMEKKQSKGNETFIKGSKYQEINTSLNDEGKKKEREIVEDSNILNDKEVEEMKYKNIIQQEKQKLLQEEKKFKSLTVRISPEENILCLASDGSQNSKDAYEIIIDEFMTRIKNSVLICPHIYNNLKDHLFNWRYQKEFVMDYYKSRLITSLAEYQGYLIMQDRNNYKNHLIEQIYEIAKFNKALYLFCGYNGLREQSLKEPRIDVGLDFLLSSTDIPIFIIKDNLKRKTKNRGYKWLLLMDRSSSDCLKVFDLFLPFIDLDLDFVYGLTLLPPYVAFDDIKKQFYEKMKELELDEEISFAYQSISYKSNPSVIVKDFVNHNTTDYFDFVIFYNNPDKFKFQKRESESIKYIKGIKANIAFSNVVYKEGYDPKIIGKLPNEPDDRRYLYRIRPLSASSKSTETKATSKLNEFLFDETDYNAKKRNTINTDEAEMIHKEIESNAVPNSIKLESEVFSIKQSKEVSDNSKSAKEINNKKEDKKLNSKTTNNNKIESKKYGAVNNNNNRTTNTLGKQVVGNAKKYVTNIHSNAKNVTKPGIKTKK